MYDNEIDNKLKKSELDYRCKIDKTNIDELKTKYQKCESVMF